MANLLEVPLKLLGMAYEALKEVPLPLLLAGLAATILSTIAFVGPSGSAQREDEADFEGRFMLFSLLSRRYLVHLTLQKRHT